MRRLLVAHDLSPRADRALDRALQLAQEHGADLAVLHVVDQELPVGVREALGRQALAWMRGRLRDLGERGEAQVFVDEGLDFAAIARRAEDLGADLIVMGPPREQLLAEMFVGTTVERVMRSCGRPVLLVKRPTARRYARIVAGVDLSAASALAVRSAAALFPEASIRATYVLDLPVGTADAAPVQNMSEAEADVDAFLSASDLGAVVATRSALVGEPARSLEIVAAQDGADLVVVGTAGRGGLPRALLGSTAQAILRQAPTDVLTVPRPPGER